MAEDDVTLSVDEDGDDFAEDPQAPDLATADPVPAEPEPAAEPSAEPGDE